MNIESRTAIVVTDDMRSDEADVFIDSRGSKGEGDLSKNALVSGS